MNAYIVKMTKDGSVQLFNKGERTRVGLNKLMVDEGVNLKYIHKDPCYKKKDVYKFKEV